MSQNFIHTHLHTEHCLSGDTIIYNCLKHHKGKKVYRNDYTRLKICRTIEYLYKYWGKSGSTFRYKVKVFDGEKFIPSLIKSIVFSGEKEVYELTTIKGKKIKASAEHKFLTKNGWKRVKELVVGDLMGCNGQPLYEDKEWLYQKYRIEKLKQEQIAKLCGVKRKVISTRIVKFGFSKTRSEWCTGREITDQLRKSLSEGLKRAHEQGKFPIKPITKPDSARKISRQKNKGYCEKCGDINKRLDVHHKDKNPFNNEDFNLITLCQRCYKEEHSIQTWTARYEELISIQKIGIEKTYDLEVIHESHNFVANGFITHNSYLDGLGSSQKYAKFAKELGFTHLAITEHGHVDSAIQFQKACKQEGIWPIFGIEFYIVPDISIKEKGEFRSHIVCIAKNETGWENILQLVTKSNIDGFYYKPRISSQMLLEHREGLIITSACTASFLVQEWGQKLLEDLIEQNKEDIYLEIMPHQFQEQIDLNILCDMYAKKYGIKLIATNDSHYVHKKDVKNHEVLLAMQTKKLWSDPQRWVFKDPGSYYLKTRMEMAGGFREQGALSNEVYQQALTNTMEIAEKCSRFTKIPQKEISLPMIPYLMMEDDVILLKRLCEDGFVTRLRDLFQDRSKIRQYRKRLEEELDLIIKKKFVRYFLIVWELMDWCKKNNIFRGPARGSSSGSLVCYLLGITDVDPIKHNLLFFRFLHEGRNDLPDIDIDIEDVKRGQVRTHLEELYGKWNVSGVSTIAVMGGKAALRNVARVFEIPLKDVNMVCNAVIPKLKGDDGYEESIQEAIESTEEGKWFSQKYPEIAKIAIDMEGTISNKGAHAAAVVISDTDLRDGSRCSFSLDRDKNPIINWDKNDIEYVGLMKLDLLGLSMLSILSEAKRLIKINKGIDINFNEIPLDDRKCLREFSKGNNIGCFQVGSQGLIKFCKELGIDSFKTLVDATSLYRPGPLRSGISSSYILRKNKQQEIPYQHLIIDKITQDTFGTIVYQEQVMRLVVELAGLDWNIADKIRKDIAKSKGEEALRKYEEQFVNGCVNNKTIDRYEAEELWADIISFGSYSFSINHATAYSLITFWDMFLKCYYPTEFICALLTYGATGTKKKEKKNEYIQEAYRLGIDIRPPKVGVSDPYLWVIKDNALYAPFMEIKGVAEKTAEKFTQLKSKGFYVSTKEKEPVTKRFLNILDNINAYDDSVLSEEESIRVSNFLDFSLVRNGMDHLRVNY